MDQSLGAVLFILLPGRCWCEVSERVNKPATFNWNFISISIIEKRFRDRMSMHGISTREIWDGETWCWTENTIREFYNGIIMNSAW